LLAVERDTTLNALAVEAFNDLLRKYGKRAAEEPSANRPRPVTDAAPSDRRSRKRRVGFDQSFLFKLGPEVGRNLGL